MAQNNIVTIEHLSKVYTERQIFQDTDFSINEGEKVALIGVNGTGKSTLLRIIAGLEEPDEGSMAMRRELDPLSSADAVLRPGGYHPGGDPA